MELSIADLLHHPELRPTVAGWIHHEFWRDKPGVTPATLEARLAEAIDPACIPLSLVAIAGGVPVGTVNLIENDDEKRPHLRPWLAALLVRPEYRGRGIGSRLVGELRRRAAALGVETMCLGTDNPGFYERLGAEKLERARSDLWVMRLPTGAPPARR